MKKSVKIIIALVVVSCLTSFLSSESQERKPTEISVKQPPSKTHTYDKLKCDSLEVEFRIESIDSILVKL